MESKVISISLPAALVKKIDQLAIENFENRSDYIRMAIVMRMKGQSLIEITEQAFTEQALKEL